MQVFVKAKKNKMISYIKKNHHKLRNVTIKIYKFVSVAFQ